MGVTVHWSGTLSNESAFPAFMHTLRTSADESGWRLEVIDRPLTRLSRVIDEQDVDYEGPTRGATLFLHPECEPVTFEFDRHWYLQDYCKTQFAGVEVHIQLISLLELLEPYFDSLSVNDEGEYWASGDRSILEKHFAYIQNVIQEILAERPSALSPSRFGEGRLLDVADDKDIIEVKD